MSPNNHNDNSCPGIERVTGTNGQVISPTGGHYFPFYIQGVETVTFKQPESRDTKHVYTIYVEWTAPVGNEELTFPDTNAWVSLTDGIITEEIHMEAKVSEHGQIRCTHDNSEYIAMPIDLSCKKVF